MEQFKCRCSAIGKIMTEPRLKADKEAGLIGETAKTFVSDVWLQNKFNYREDVFTDEIKKGLLCEQDSIKLVQSVLGGQFRTTFKKLVQNEFIIGTPDIDQDKDDCVEDIKTAFSLKTFHNAECTKDNEYQIRGYMAILGRSKGRIIYTFVESPLEIITNLIKRIYYQFECDETNEDYIRITQQIDYNHSGIIKTIPPEQRVKVFEFTRDVEIENKIYEQVKKCRSYYNSLTL